MGVFYILKIVQMVPNRVKRLTYVSHDQRINLPISVGILPISEESRRTKTKINSIFNNFTGFRKFRLKSTVDLTHFKPMFRFYTSWKRQKSWGFPMFQEVSKWNIGLIRANTEWHKTYMLAWQFFLRIFIGHCEVIDNYYLRIILLK